MRRCLFSSFLVLWIAVLFWWNFSFWADVNIIDLFTATIKAANDAADKGDDKTAIEYYNQAKEICEKFPEYKDQLKKSCDLVDTILSKYEWIWEEIQCDEWYIIDETKTKCVKDSIDQRKLNCRTWLWENSELSKENNDDCVCKEWYMINASQTKCIPYSAEQMKLNCEIWYWEHSVVAEVTKCNCEEGYTWSYDGTFCDVDLDQKSLASRMVNTLDAKCDTDSVINACKDDPTGDTCPAVCLELYDAINWMFDNWLTIYKNPKQFWVYNEMTREQSSKFFSNFYKTVFEKPLIMPTENPFNDIDNADPTLIDYIKYSYNLWLFKGTNWKFMPFNSITKAQSLAVIIRMIAWVLDENWAKWYSEYLRRAENLSLLDNITYSLETLDNENIKRWDVALILYRLFLSLNK